MHAGAGKATVKNSSALSELLLIYTLASFKLQLAFVGDNLLAQEETHPRIGARDSHYVGVSSTALGT